MKGTRNRTVVSWGQFSALLKQVMDKTGFSQNDIMQHMGYAAHSSTSRWAEAEEVPTVAYMALKAVAHELLEGEKVVEIMRSPFTHDELMTMIRLAAEANEPEIIVKLATLMKRKAS